MRVFLLASVLVLATPAQAQWLTGNDLHDWCSKPALEFGCLGYVMGSLDQASWKIPPNATRGQVKDVVKKYLIDNPEQRDLPASFLVSLAVLKAWPTYNPPKVNK